MAFSDTPWRRKKGTIGWGDIVIKSLKNVPTPGINQGF